MENQKIGKSVFIGTTNEKQQAEEKKFQIKKTAHSDRNRKVQV